MNKANKIITTMDPIGSSVDVDNDIVKDDSNYTPFGVRGEIHIFSPN